MVGEGVRKPPDFRACTSISYNYFLTATVNTDKNAGVRGEQLCGLRWYRPLYFVLVQIPKP